MTVTVSFDKSENPMRLTNLRVTINLPHGVCGKHEAALMRVVEHCPVHETIATLGKVQFEIVDASALAAV